MLLAPVLVLFVLPSMILLASRRRFTPRTQQGPDLGGAADAELVE
jgi:hypothetical protein